MFTLSVMLAHVTQNLFIFVSMHYSNVCILISLLMVISMFTFISMENSIQMNIQIYYFMLSQLMNVA